MEGGGASGKIPLVDRIDFSLMIFVLPVIPPVTIPYYTLRDIPPKKRDQETPRRDKGPPKAKPQKDVKNTTGTGTASKKKLATRN